MKIFLAGIIQGSIAEARIHNQDWRTAIKDALTAHVADADVYCHFTQHPNSITYDLPMICRTLEDGNDRAAACDVLVAYAPSASMGTAIEMYLAAKHGALVLTISPLAANWVIRAYSDRIFETIEQFEKFLASGEFMPLYKEKRRGDVDARAVPK